MKITKEDIGREVIYKPMGMLASIVVIVDGKPWCKYKNGGYVGIIEDKDLNDWEYLDNSYDKLYDNYIAIIKYIYSDLKIELKIIRERPFNNKGKVLEYLECKECAYALVINAGDNVRLWRFRSMDYIPIEISEAMCENMYEFMKYVKLHRVRDYYY